MTDLELLVWIFGVAVVAGNIWMYWYKWQRKKAKKQS